MNAKYTTQQFLCRIFLPHQQVENIWKITKVYCLSHRGPAADNFSTSLQQLCRNLVDSTIKDIINTPSPVKGPVTPLHRNLYRLGINILIVGVEA